jgi:hypothetical protein
LLGTSGAGGSWLTTAVVNAGELVHPFTVAVTLYVPAFDKPTLLITGFCTDDVNPFGPVQLYEALAIDDAIKFKFAPSQTAELLDAVGDDGTGLTVTLVLTAMLVHCPVVTVTEYEPASEEVALLITGFCKDEVKPFGPVQLYVAPAVVDANKFNVLPAQTGELLLMIGGVGRGVVATATD